jgi:hypothetical protein
MSTIDDRTTSLETITGTGINIDGLIRDLNNALSRLFKHIQTTPEINILWMKLVIRTRTEDVFSMFRTYSELDQTIKLHRFDNSWSLVPCKDHRMYQDYWTVDLYYQNIQDNEVYCITCLVTN